MNTDGTEEDIDKPTAPPPKDSELTGEINRQRLAIDTQELRLPSYPSFS